MNLSQKERKLIASLRIKKYRAQYSLFIAEGEKVIEQLLHNFPIELLLVRENATFTGTNLERMIEPEKVRSVDTKLMRSLSELESRHDYIAIFKKKQAPTLPQKIDELSVGLEEIQNPGNMGTLIRLCDWLGIRSIFCSKGCVDAYSPKVVQATAGALGNVDIYTDMDFSTQLPSLFDEVVGTALDGTSYSDYMLPTTSTIILFGNEGAGLTEETLTICQNSLSIAPAETTISESLNVSISAAILLSHFKRR